MAKQLIKKEQRDYKPVITPALSGIADVAFFSPMENATYNLNRDPNDINTSSQIEKEGMDKLKISWENLKNNLKTFVDNNPEFGKGFLESKLIESSSPASFKTYKELQPRKNK